MLDVHPPHHPVHAWKDFFIHIATIVVGLLIAVGLEQMVEAIHRAHERASLVEEMHAEAERNLPVLESNIRRAQDAKVWARQAIAVLSKAPADQTITVTLPPGTVEIEGNQPSHAVWDIAKANGKAGLVPDDLAEAYDRQKGETEGQGRAVDKVVAEKQIFDTLQARLQTRIVAGATLTLTPPDRAELIRVIATNVASASAIQYWSAAWAGTAEALTRGTPSRAELDESISHHRQAVPQ